MKKMSPSLIHFCGMMILPSFLLMLIIPTSLIIFLSINNYDYFISLLIVIASAVLLSIVSICFIDKSSDPNKQEKITLNYTKKNKRAKSVINLDTHKSVMYVIEKNHKLRVYFVDFEFFITEFIKNSDKVYDANKIHELDNQIRESYETVTNLLLSDGVKSVLNGYAKDFKKDVINVAAALIKKHRDIVYDLALEAQNAVNERNAMKEKDKNSKAEQDAVSIIQNPEYKNLVQEG